MKKNVFIICSFLLIEILIHATPSSAELLDLYINFKFQEIWGRVPMSYNVYCDDTLVHIIKHRPGPETFFVESNGESVLSFRIAAVMNGDGDESPLSDPFLFTVRQQPKAPSGFQIGFSTKLTTLENYHISFLPEKYNTIPCASIFYSQETSFTSAIETMQFARKIVLVVT